MSVKKFKKFYESKIQNVSSKYLDYYYLNEEISLTSVREIYELIEDNAYRGFATFAHNIEHFEEIDAIKIALMNYPPERHTKRNFKIKFNDLKKNYKCIDEIEFPWNKRYSTWGEKFWRDIVLESIEFGFKLRPMLEIGIMSEAEIEYAIDFLKSVGIRSIVTSTGLIQEITTINKWNDIKHIFPRLFETKVVGIVTLDQVNEFLKSNIDLAATTISITSNYNLNDSGDDYFGDNEQWSLPTNI